MAQIIVVEDDVYMREELIDVLEKAGYDAVPLLDFENAVSQIMSLSPDLILLDINLPFHSGFEICKEVKAKQLGTVLILTAIFLRYAAMFRVGTSFIFSRIKSRSASVTLNLICTVLLRPSMLSLLSIPRVWDTSQ